MFPFGETIIRIRAPRTPDAYNPAGPGVPDWSAAVETSLDGFAVDPGGSTEAATVNREQITTSPTLYGPFGADVVASDRVRVRGVTWEVAGNRADWRNPFTGWEAGSSWPLRAVEG